MSMPRKDQLFLYESFAVGSHAHALPHGAAARTHARLEVNEATRPSPPTSKPVREPSGLGPSELASLVITESSKLVHGQQNLIHQLVSTCEKLQQEIDFWKNKVEALYDAQRSGTGAIADGARIDAVRKLLARELHPDKSNLSPEEAAVRSSLFKTIWPKIDQIARGQPAT